MYLETMSQFTGKYTGFSSRAGTWAYSLETHASINTTFYKYSWKPGSFCMRKLLRYSIK